MKTKLRISVDEAGRITDHPEMSSVISLQLSGKQDEAELKLGKLACVVLGLGAMIEDLLDRNGCEVVFVDSMPSHSPGIRLLDTF